MKKRKYDWAQFAIHAFFGCVLGVIVGSTIGFFIGFFYVIDLRWPAAIGAVVYALVAGIKGDEFWLQLGR